MVGFNKASSLWRAIVQVMLLYEGGKKMKIVKQSVEIMDKLDGKEILKSLELAGRVCYKSDDKITG